MPELQQREEPTPFSRLEDSPDGVLDEKSKALNTQEVETNGQALVEFSRLIGGTRRLFLEECEQSQWLHEILSPPVDELVVIFGEKPRGNNNDGVARRPAELPGTFARRMVFAQEAVSSWHITEPLLDVDVGVPRNRVVEC